MIVFVYCGGILEIVKPGYHLIVRVIWVCENDDDSNDLMGARFPATLATLATLLQIGVCIILARSSFILRT